MLNDICISSRKHQKKIAKTTEFLSRQFGISYFGIQYITTEGHWNLVTSNPQWVEHCANEKFYLHDPTLVKPDLYGAGIAYISAHPDPAFRTTLLKTAAEQFDMDHCLAIVNKKHDVNEFIFFATSCANTQIIQTYITQFKLLQRFVRYFKLENQRAFENAAEYSVDLKQLKKQTYFNSHNAIECVPEKSNAELDTIIYKFSKREEQCLHFLLEGKTAKEIAKILSLSYRTIEEYIGNLKRKSRCRHLHDLFVLFKDRL